jgi:hypothetical protein
LAVVDPGRIGIRGRHEAFAPAMALVMEVMSVEWVFSVPGLAILGG